MVHVDVREVAPGVRLHTSADDRWKTAAIALRIAADLDDDPTRTALVPFVLARGTARSPRMRDLAVRLEKLYDAELDIDVLRMGDHQVIELRIELADARFVRGGSDPTEAGFELLAELLFTPALTGSLRFRDDVVAGEKKRLRHEIEGLFDDRTEYAIERATRLLGRGEPSGRYEYGDVADLDGIDAGSLTARWRSLVEAHPIEVIAAGRIRADSLERVIRDRFPLAGRARRCPAPIRRVPSRARGSGPVRETERHDMEQSHLCLGYRTGIRYLDEAYAALLVLHAVLGADAQSRLFLRVREGEGLAYEAGTILDRMKGDVIAHFGTGPGDLDETEALARREVERVRDELVPASELEQAKRFCVERVAEVEDDPLLRIAFAHARRLAGRSEATIAGLSADIESVSAEGVRDAARRLELDAIFAMGP